MKFILGLLLISPVFAGADYRKSELVSSQSEYREHRYLLSSDGKNVASGNLVVEIALSGKLTVNCNIEEVTTQFTKIDASNLFLVQFKYKMSNRESLCVGPDKEITLLDRQKIESIGSMINLIVPSGMNIEIHEVTSVDRK